MILSSHGDAVYMLGDALISDNRARIADFVTRNRLPSMFTTRQSVEAGGLVAYGTSFVDLFRRAALYVDKILKGARPGDLPVEQPRKFDLVINMRTAKTVGLTIPQALLLRADHVVQ
jgi:putative tryptophan/tyrosine transport system substrate-binding protein